jgi:two-component system sensor histidine kinase MtrB
MGMTAEDAERVFDRFWRADPSRTRTIGGTGLGLSIALGDARLHRGTLAVWSQPGEGTSLLLPPRARNRWTARRRCLWSRSKRSRRSA